MVCIIFNNLTYVKIIPPQQLPEPASLPEFFPHQSYRAHAGLLGHHGDGGAPLSVSDDERAVPEQGADVLCEAPEPGWVVLFAEPLSLSLFRAGVDPGDRGGDASADLEPAVAESGDEGVSGSDLVCGHRILPRF